MRIETARAARPWREYGSSVGGSAVLHVLLILMFLYVTPKVVNNRWVGGSVIFQPVKPHEQEPIKPKNVPVRKTEMPSNEHSVTAPAPEPEHDFRPKGVHDAAQPDMLSLGKDFAHSPKDQVKTVDLSQIPVARTGGDISNSFQVPQKPGGAARRDSANISFKDAVPGMENRDGRSPAQAYLPGVPEGGSGSGQRRRNDTADNALSAGLAAQKKTDKPKVAVADVDSSKWEQIDIAGPVAQYQPDCLGVTGDVYRGNFRLRCRNDQIVMAWRKIQY